MLNKKGPNTNAFCTPINKYSESLYSGIDCKSYF